MTKRPLLNALLAALYVSLIALFFTFAPLLPEPKGTALVPLAMLSLLTLSAAIMAFLFFYQPVALLAKGEQSAAFKLLLQTLGCFAGITVIFFAILASVSLL